MDHSAEAVRLRAAVRDLLALSALPDVWAGREPRVLATELADLLIESLRLDFAFVRLCDPETPQTVEAIRGDAWPTFPEWLRQRLAVSGQISCKEVVSQVSGPNESLSGVVIPIGVDGERGLVAAACYRSDFPDQIDQQLLSVAANSAATAFRNAHLINELRNAQKVLCDREQELRTARDELEIKVAERTSELRRSEAYLAEAQRLSQTGSWAWSPGTDVRHWSEECYRVLGFDPRDGLPRTEELIQRIHPDDRSMFRESVMTAMHNKLDEGVNYRIVHPGGAVRDIYSIGHPVFSPSGDLIEYTGTVIDVTERKRAEQELQQLVDFVPQLIVVLDSDGNVIHANRVAREYTGLTLEEFRSLDVVGRVMHPDDVERVRAARKLGFEGSKPFELDARLRGKDGIYRWFLRRYNPLVEEGRARRWYLTATEIESRKQEEERIRQENVRLEERTRIAQELHDTLLQTFQSASLHLGAAVLRVAQDSPVKSQLEGILEIMRQGIVEGRGAIQGLRSSGYQCSDLVGALSHIQDELKVQPDIDFRVTVTGRQKQLAPEIQLEIYRISREALFNAFTHSGAKRIELELAYSDSELHVQIRDNGCGIDPHMLETGRDGHWGLAGMRERATRIGGVLTILSSPAAGTEVQLSIPISIPSELSLPHHGSR
jgi:PAS domain S-box-containing protein